MAAHMAYLPRFLPGATVSDEPDLVLVDSGLPSDTLNTICRARLASETADDRHRHGHRPLSGQGFPVRVVGRTGLPPGRSWGVADRARAGGGRGGGRHGARSGPAARGAASGGTRRAESDRTGRADGLRLGGGCELGSARSRNRRVLRARRRGRARSGMPGTALRRILGRRAGRHERVFPGPRRGRALRRRDAAARSPPRDRHRP